MYGACVLIAIFVGYHISSWDQMPSFSTLIAVLLLMFLPFLLKWHHFWLILSWNTYAMVFFLPGRPNFMLVLGGLSLLVSLIEHGIKQEVPFIYVGSLFWPIIFLVCVIMATAKLTGGIGLNVLGSSNVGGRKYIFLLGGVVGYFALTAQRIPREKVLRYTSAFFLSPVSNLVSDLSLFLGPSAVYYIYLLLPSTGALEQSAAFGANPDAIERMAGIASCCSAVVYTMMARYGLKGVFDGKKVWRPPVFVALVGLSLLGGFRGTLVTILMTGTFLFCLEGLYRSRFTPVLLCGIVLGGVLLFPLGEHLPLSMQRSLTVLPFVKVSDLAERSAKDSSDWRVQMWKEVAPEIPGYLILGKGYSINTVELEKVTTETLGNESVAGAELAGDYHNGPLSVIIPFGIGGAIGFLWLAGAGFKVMYNNYKYGDPGFRQVNNYFFAAYMAKVIYFFAVFGALESDLSVFLGLLGMSVAINGGMRQRVKAPFRQKAPSPAWKLGPARPAALN
jgi:O-Antigen ligase